MLIRPMVTAVLIGALVTGGCRVERDAEPAAEPAPATDAAAFDDARRDGDPAASAGARGQLRFEVSVADRELYVYENDRRVATHPVAVGREDYETVTGEFRIHQVDFNPRWVPPDSEWAEGREPKEPGDPDNPMGHARLIFHQTYSIHGTDETGSLGEAASHGSIRVSNDVVEQLARMVMEHGGAERGEDFFRRVRDDRSQMQQVRIPEPVPIVVR
jgi:lipoprotein-anchoring transpeptidase ErfK/SrfK